MLQKHFATSDQIAEIDRLSEARRSGTTGEAETADAELDRFLRAHGVTLGQYDSAIMDRISEEWGLDDADRRRARANAQVNAAPIDRCCPACALLISSGCKDSNAIYLPHVPRPQVALNGG
ncbi:hypothetical protein NCF85_08160 [Qipengyuania citrea]|jgi:hypothetical protein|uniref:Uncharacterized protein n=1 Tax=Qipengyuania citrea TaxID=225971 RepID=A0ABY4U3Z7_9SPHN|nr:MULTISPECIES: hypothetical protein [Qipengyuania]MBY8335026.1 hypothetical protein [Qipengyuania pacifica]MCH2495495.1 hypothetical protein [Erythrobacter sp.]USA60098.1 hypothetical protein NCF85_08160 [Qipengyuania citrea]